MLQPNKLQSASIKLVFEAAKVELEPESPPSKKARCVVSDPYAGIASKTEALSPSASSPSTSRSAQVRAEEARAD